MGALRRNGMPRKPATSSESINARRRAQPRARVELIYQGRVFSLRRHTAVEPGGVRVVRDLIHHPGSAVILPLLPDGRVVLVRQYRLAAGAMIWELPAGTIDPGEEPLETARRELTEETGYRTSRWRKLTTFFPSPGLLSERMHLFLARDVRPGPARPEADERITTHPFTRPQLLRMVRAGEIQDGKTLVGLLFWTRWGKEFGGRSRRPAREAGRLNQG
jgi:ADP-ribose pyrophosphatase